MIWVRSVCKGLNGYWWTTMAGKELTLYLIDSFAKRADPDQTALVRAAWSRSTLFAYGNMIYLILHQWTWQVISLFYVPTWKFIYIVMNNGWSLAWIFMKERVKYRSWVSLLRLFLNTERSPVGFYWSLKLLHIIYNQSKILKVV